MPIMHCAVYHTRFLPCIFWVCVCTHFFSYTYNHTYWNEGKSISKLQIVIEKRRMGIVTYKQDLFFNVISIQI